MNPIVRQGLTSHGLGRVRPVVALVSLHLLVLTQLACTSCGGSEPEPADAFDAGFLPTEPNAFGQWVRVEGEWRTLLYPTLERFAAPPEALVALLPEALPGREAVRTDHGVHEADDAAVMAAARVYGVGADAITLMVEDTAWEPTRILPRLRCWSEGPAGASLDGRELCAGDAASGERRWSIPLGYGPVPRVVAVAAGGADVPAADLREALELVPAAGGVTLASRGQSPSDPPPALKGCDGCELLQDGLLDRLGPPVGEVLAEDEAYRREARTNVVRTATRVYRTEAGPLIHTLTDLGPVGHEATLASRPARLTSVAELRHEVPERGRGRCSSAYATCKWTALVANRWLWTVSGPASAGLGAHAQAGRDLLSRDPLTRGPASHPD